MLVFLLFLSLFILLRLLAGSEPSTERFSAAALQSPREQPIIDGQPAGFVYPIGIEPHICYTSPHFEDPYEEWHYYRHHLHSDELLGNLRQNFQEEYTQGIFGEWDRHNSEVVDGAWRSDG